MDVSGTEELAAELLGVSSMRALVRGLIARALLPGGRVEAHEYGRRQHSSASAGAVLIGFSGSRAVSDTGATRLVAVVSDLIDDEGRVRSHDGDAENGDSVWAQSQILLGLLLCPNLVMWSTKLAALAKRLLALQDESGGWPFRGGEAPSVAFTFYPVLALVRVADRVDGARESMVAARCFLEFGLREGRFCLEEQVMAQFALEEVSRISGTKARCAERRTQLLDACWSAGEGVRVHDLPVTVSRQPVWHSILWRPLLYLCVRRWVSPLSALGVLLGGELVGTFDREIAAWRGPVAGVNLGSGVSWASASAFRGAVAFARDLRRAGASAAEFRARWRQLSSESYVYDVAISFAGMDRPVAERIARRLKAAGLRVFYDRDQQHFLLGEDLAALLHTTYYADSRFAVVVISRAYLESKWAGNWELKAVLARMQEQHSGYALPYIMEDVSVPGLSPTLGHVAAVDFTAEEFADMVVRKFRTRLRQK